MTIPTKQVLGTLGYFLLLCFIRPTRSSFTLTVEPGEEECFVIRTPANRASVITGSYECLDDDVNEDSFSVSFSDQETSEVLYQPKKGTLEGVFKFDNKLKQGKRYALCFENTSEEEDDEWDVGFSMRVTNAQRTLPDDELGPDSKRALQLVNKATAIHEDWSSLRDHFDFLRNREAVHKHLSDATMSRLQRWTWIEAILVTSMATGQILYWRRFFEQRRYL